MSEDSGELLSIGLSAGTPVLGETASPEFLALPVVLDSFEPVPFLVAAPARFEASDPEFDIPVCANASVELMAMAEANAIFVSFMVHPFDVVGSDENQPVNEGDVPET